MRGDILYVSDEENHRVQMFDKESGSFVRAWGSEGAGIGQFKSPHGLAVSREGQLWVCDKGNKRVQIFD